MRNTATENRTTEPEELAGLVVQICNTFLEMNGMVHQAASATDALDSILLALSRINTRGVTYTLSLEPEESGSGHPHELAMVVLTIGVGDGGIRVRFRDLHTKHISSLMEWRTFRNALSAPHPDPHDLQRALLVALVLARSMRSIHAWLMESLADLQQTRDTLTHYIDAIHTLIRNPELNKILILETV